MLELSINGMIVLMRRKLRIFPLLSIIIGLVCLGMVVFPMITWQISFAFGDFNQEKIVSPVPDLDSFSVAGGQLPKASGFGLILLSSANILPPPPLPPTSGFDKKAFISEFTLSIPKLKIFDANVKVDSENFDQFLALFPGTALPGEEGNAFISGHSVLPQFFNPEDYKKIFSTLPQLEIGDEVLVNIAGVEYRFLVESKRVVDPDDVSVLAPPTLGKYLTLLTCVPPGTSLKRLVVVCKLAVAGS